MKEILYIQAGPSANHVGTHFWNAQESYFTYGEDEDPTVFHDRSFREGVTSKVTLEGGVVEYRQDPIPKSAYQARLEAGESDELEDKDVTTDTSNVRFWSDYSRVYYHPRSFQKLPDLAEWERAEGEWNASKETFEKHEHEHDIMDDDVRFFIEECDGLQGVQLLSDCGSFGGFTDAFITAFRDEHPKIPSLAFALLSSASNILVHADEEQNAMKAINDALCMRSIEAMSTISVPLQHPSTWQRKEWLEGLNVDLRSQYHTSALLATHIESATLPLRLKRSQHDIASLSSMLNASGTLGISHLAGRYPVPSAVVWSRETERRLYDLSAITEASAKSGNTRAAEYARLHVSRGFNASEYAPYEDYFDARSPAPFSIHATPYPTPTSFPHISTSPSEKHRALSALTTSSATAPLLASYATLVQSCADRRADVIVRMGMEFDEMRELKDDLWALCDRYAGPDEEWKGEEDVLSEDEET
ncbi:Protein dml-1 [Trametes pubescens]|uniref:Protein dml-1 n=1 Tax=Trametes pubescens TaxID=154538 RepID=A0A1M2VXM3_TRAPU|nr:Protein dml-1 [Trametes pubescens]